MLGGFGDTTNNEFPDDVYFDVFVWLRVNC